jgi:energy-coupling factor transporter ATP-binding protein EcfA2
MLDEGEVKDRVYKALEAVDLLEFKEHSPFNLSWGQKKKAALAGLLVMKPNLLILDEPFENLDLKSIYNHLIIFEKLRKEERMTIIYSTHNLFFIENWAENVLLLDRGKGIFEGDPKEGLMNPRMKSIMGSYAELKELIDKHKKIATNIHF